jgi:hypothetical protein
VGEGLQGAESDDVLERLYQRIHRLPTPRAALCLSGGGVRSASFALGVLQALARHGLLQEFHYLSTVSGGGYIGAWLSAWRYHEPYDNAVFTKLIQRGGYSVGHGHTFAEPAELRDLRANMGTLIPKIDFLSADTWSWLFIYLRNVILNWLVFGPLFLSLLMLPDVSFELLSGLNNILGTANPTMLAVGGLLLLAGLAVSVAGRPTRDRDKKGSPERPIALNRRRFIEFVLLPMYGAACFFIVYVAWLPTTPEGMRWQVVPTGAVFGAVVYLLAWLVGFFAGGGRVSELLQIVTSTGDPVPPLAEMIWYTLSGAAGGLMVALGIALYQYLSGLAETLDVSAQVIFLFQGYNRIYMIVSAGIAWTITAILMADLLFAGLMSYHRYRDSDLEWSARAAGYLAPAAVGWFTFAGLVLYDPPVSTGVLIGGLGATGLAILLLGNSKKSPTGTTRATTAFLSVATIVFILLLAILLSKLSRIGLDTAVDVFGATDTSVNGWIGIQSFIVLLMSGLVASYWININRFSLNAVYRNRLIQTFLGAARASHRGEGRTRSNPDPFTGFDQGDDLPLASLWSSGGNSGRRCLFHVFNMSLNVIASQNLGRQVRRTESFVMTPLACGNPLVNFIPTGFYDEYGGGITLGTAMAISGAPRNPNRISPSSPLIGLVMMLFNARLGWWLGNPRTEPRFYRRAGPILATRLLLDELAGKATETGRYIYLSDGGHFENLGLYEMVRRRCGFVLVVDAGADPAGLLEDLGNAIRKIWLDLGIHIEFDRVDLGTREKQSSDSTYCALGRILYPEAEAREGLLVYVKPGFDGSEPPDVRSYAALHPEFPHESTTDRWFSEAQMESYRALGYHIITKICRGGGKVSSWRYEEDLPKIDVDKFIGLIREYLEGTKPYNPLEIVAHGVQEMRETLIPPPLINYDGYLTCDIRTSIKSLMKGPRAVVSSSETDLFAAVQLVPNPLAGGASVHVLINQGREGDNIAFDIEPIGDDIGAAPITIRATPGSRSPLVNIPLSMSPDAGGEDSLTLYVSQSGRHVAALKIPVTIYSPDRSNISDG